MTDRFTQLEDLLQKCGKDFQKGKLLRLIELSGAQPGAKAAIKFISELDKIIDIYFRPTGDIAVNGFQDGLCRYRSFHLY